MVLLWGEAMREPLSIGNVLYFEWSSDYRLCWTLTLPFICLFTMWIQKSIYVLNEYGQTEPSGEWILGGGKTDNSKLSFMYIVGVMAILGC